MFSENLCTLLKILNCLTSRIFGAVDHEHVGPHVKSIDSGRILNSCDCASSKDKVHIYSRGGSKNFYLRGQIVALIYLSKQPPIYTYIHAFLLYIHFFI